MGENMSAEIVQRMTAAVHSYMERKDRPLVELLHANAEAMSASLKDCQNKIEVLERQLAVAQQVAEAASARGGSA